MAANNIIALAFDSRMFEQARACIETIRQHCAYPFDIGVVAIDLAEAELAWLAERGVKVFSDVGSLPHYASAPAHAVAMTCRPYLPQIFPGFDCYLWVDADVRFCHAHAFEFYLGIGSEPQTNIAIVQEVDTAYSFIKQPQQAREYHAHKFARMQHVFGQDAASSVSFFHSYNAGIFAMRRESPVWNVYRRKLEIAMAGEFHHMLDQDALLLAILETGGPSVGPSIFNWLCSVALPKFSDAEQRWVRPEYPYLPISSVHLTNSFEDARVVGEAMTWMDVYKRMQLTT